MSQQRLTIDIHRQAARAFVASKGRLPGNFAELVAWLMEFTDELGALLQHWQEAAVESTLASINTASISIREKEGE